MTDRRNQHEPEPSMGSDEEGEFPVSETTETDDHAAWVHRKHHPEDKTA